METFQRVTACHKDLKQNEYIEGWKLIPVKEMLYPFESGRACPWMGSCEDGFIGHLWFGVEKDDLVSLEHKWKQ